MTGPEHYRLAEAKLEAAYEVAKPESGHSDENAIRLVAIALQRAQVHATLAHTAAVIAGTALSPADRHEWQQAIEPEYEAAVAAARAAATDPAGPGWAQVKR